MGLREKKHRELLAAGPGNFFSARAGFRKCELWRRAEFWLQQRCPLKITTIVPGRSDSVRSQLRGHIGRRNQFVRRAATPPAQRVGSQKFHMRPDTGGAQSRCRCRRDSVPWAYRWLVDLRRGGLSLTDNSLREKDEEQAQGEQRKSFHRVSLMRR